MEQPSLFSSLETIICYWLYVIHNTFYTQNTSFKTNYSNDDQCYVVSARKTHVWCLSFSWNFYDFQKLQC